MKPAAIHALSLTLGLAAVTHAKTLLIEQLPQDTTENQKLVYRTDRPPPMNLIGSNVIKQDPRSATYLSAGPSGLYE